MFYEFASIAGRMPLEAVRWSEVLLYQSDLVTNMLVMVIVLWYICREILKHRSP